MSDNTAPQLDLEKAISELLEKGRKDAYADGWKDAMAAVNVKVASIPFPENFAPAKSGPPNLFIKKRAMLLPGTTPHIVYHVIKKMPGMTGAQIVAAVKEGGHDLAEPSIRTAIFRLANKRKSIVNRHGKWFPV